LFRRRRAIGQLRFNMANWLDREVLIFDFQNMDSYSQYGITRPC
jgi:hypothetical protein